MKIHNTEAMNYVMQLSEKKNYFWRKLNETNFEKLFTPPKTLEKTHSSCSQFDAL